MVFSTYRYNYLCTCGGNRTYGKTLYIFGGPSSYSPSEYTSRNSSAQAKKNEACETSQNAENSLAQNKTDSYEASGFHDNDSSEYPDLTDQLGSCTTDTEKELAKLKLTKHAQDRHVQKLQSENAELRDKLVSLGVDASAILSSSAKVLNSSSTDKNQLEQIAGDTAEIVNRQINNHGQSTGASVHVVSNKTQTNQQQATLQRTCCQVCKEFQELKEAFLVLKREANLVPSSFGDIISGVQIQVQQSLSDVNARYGEVVDKYLREMKLRKKYHNELVELRGNIRVLCRIRPKIKEDGTENDAIVVATDSVDDTLVKINNKGKTQFFDVDKTFSATSTQAEVFEEVSSLVRSVIDGFNVCIFAYGQTGSGKTYTMEGPRSDPGFNQRALQLLFEETIDDNWQYQISASVLEIYNEVIRDLLNPEPDTKLEVKMKPEGGLHVPGVVAMTVSDLTTVNKIFEIGRRNRATAATHMNERSSRSHCLLCVTVEGHNPTTGTRSLGRLNLVDLAGSERVSKSMADGIHLKEAQNINKSLACLGDVIHALRNKHNHVPYRNSKLTYLLQDSLGGDSKTLMIVQVSPVEKNISETVCTLTFGQRVRSVELGTPSKNMSPSVRPSSLLTSPAPVSSSPSPTSPLPGVQPSLRQSHSSPVLTGRKLPTVPSSVYLKSPLSTTPRKSPSNSRVTTPTKFSSSITSSSKLKESTTSVRTSSLPGSPALNSTVPRHSAKSSLFPTASTSNTKTSSTTKQSSTSPPPGGPRKMTFSISAPPTPQPRRSTFNS